MMTKLIERYVHQVGRYLPPKERTEIEAELLSQIYDQLDDRYAGEPTNDEVASILTEFGHPYQIAASYSNEQYLIGPELYPFMMMVLRHGWLIVPSVVIFLHIFGTLISSEPNTFLGLVIEPLLNALQITFIFSAVVVLIFALLERSNIEFDEEVEVFKPSELPEVDDPREVDRFESAFGIAFGTFVTLLFLYFLRVGGLTLRFDMSNPSDLIPVSTLWLLLLIISTLAMNFLHVLVLRRNRWGFWLWLTETLLELFGVVCLYFVLYQPIYQPIMTAIPALSNIPFIENAPVIVAVISAIITIIARTGKLISLWNYDNANLTLTAVKSDR